MTRPVESARAKEFRSLMSGFPTGVVVVTTFGPDGGPHGMTCSSLCSVALDPPTLLVCVRQGSSTLEAVEQRGSFAVNVLHSGGRPVAELFASGAPDRFDRVPWRAGPAAAGPHLPDYARTVADCKVTGTAKPVGDHTVVFGEVLEVTSHLTAAAPLLYGLRRYATWPTGHRA
ncbi:flavin reductase family protein [Streptomyces adelaidensis]|jgi:flavin reductase (NADH)|uniref:flavin reductase family protein n=1 Tax=Streptomyces adelaidensis TaxID=2796465 RepID=UPI00190490E6|nr:flavin reductase family protein [Streptomyces adelaidensis]